jgi:hypothetical protein
LLRVECEFPTAEYDPIYVLDVRPRAGEPDADARSYTLELDLVEKLAFRQSDLVEGKVVWPLAREFAGIDVVRNRFVVGWDNHYNLSPEDRFSYERPLRTEQFKAWRDWLVSDNCDERLAGLDLDDALDLDMRADEIIDIAAERANRNPPSPLVYFKGNIQVVPDATWMGFMQAALPAFGPSLRQLQVSHYYREAEEHQNRSVLRLEPGSLPDCIDLINAHTPNLHSLGIRLQTDGLTNAILVDQTRRRPTLRGPLRVFQTIVPYKKDKPEVSQISLARAMAPFGTHRCHHSYASSFTREVKVEEEFDRFVRLCQS